VLALSAVFIIQVSDIYSGLRAFLCASCSLHGALASNRTSEQRFSPWKLNPGSDGGVKSTDVQPAAAKLRQRCWPVCVRAPTCISVSSFAIREVSCERLS